ncbi:VacJ family lipoprotein [Acinetobacter sp. ANC 4558]|uniref:MlaA family lipoprotein n=1 Tax=Acinetobacter sp. ANC 4558 TaxID=1977876 RepID=UPI000A34DB2E|nr:VacJ family lipoprotein [Acinetobacter sp. ANC 4558]OTG86667.1 VacJ family lipoprotein [Acinetobacter sp. ANC 4558]
MDHKSLLLISSFLIGISPSLYANDISESTDASSLNEKKENTNSLRDLKNVRLKDLKVDANAAQPDKVKDPLEAFNRKVHNLNETVDQHVVRPIAVQYKEKFPEDVRGSYSSFRNNLGEPWNAVNQLIQGKPLRALKTLGRFSINTLTTLGFADPAQHLGIETENENFGTTLGYYGVPSGPYIVIPVFGPSTFRDGAGLIVDIAGHPQEYLDGHDAVYWSDQAGRGINARASLLDYEGALQGDKYSALRDIYLQRRHFVIAEKKGLDADAIQFIDDVDDTLDEDADEIKSKLKK